MRSALAAGAALLPHRVPISLATDVDLVVECEESFSYETALAWFDLEHRNINAVLRSCRVRSAGVPAWQSCWSLTNYLRIRGRWSEWKELQQLALVDVDQLVGEAVLSRLQHDMSWALVHTKDWQAAIKHGRKSVALAESAGDPYAETLALEITGTALGFAGLHDEAIAVLTRALALGPCRELTNLRGHALYTLATNYAATGDLQRAVDACDEALAIYSATGNRNDQARALDKRGILKRDLGDVSIAAQAHREAVVLFNQTGDLYSEAEALRHLAQATAELGRLTEAQRHLEKSLGLLEQLAHPLREVLRSELDELRTRR